MAWLAFGTLVRELPEHGEVAVGSGPDADWRVPRAELLPRHFVVGMNGTTATVRASSTDSVVVVNGRQLIVAPQPLNDGDAILAGSGRFAFSLAPPSATVVERGPREDAFLVDDVANVAHPVIGHATTIGRDATNVVVVRDATASRFHAEVRREAGGFALHSMGASGTTLNGTVLRKPTLLKEGDVVEIAFVKLRFTKQAPQGTVPIAPPHSTSNDEAGRKPTLIGGPTVPERKAQDTRPRQIQIAIAVVVVIVLAAAVWWFTRSRA